MSLHIHTFMILFIHVMVSMAAHSLSVQQPGIYDPHRNHKKDTYTKNIFRRLLATKKEGESCNTPEECDRANEYDCCEGTCQRRVKDWVGFFYCPHECKAADDCAPGTCSNNKAIGESCNIQCSSTSCKSCSSECATGSCIGGICVAGAPHVCVSGAINSVDAEGLPVEASIINGVYSLHNALNDGKVVYIKYIDQTENAIYFSEVDNWWVLFNTYHWMELAVCTQDVDSPDKCDDWFQVKGRHEVAKLAVSECKPES